VIDEDFSKKSGAFPTGNGETYNVAVTKGARQLFLAGQGKTNTGVTIPATLESPADTVTIEADVRFELAYGKGDGGYGLRCVSGDSYYGVVFSPGVGEDSDAKVFVTRSEGDGFDIVAEEPPPTNSVGSDGLLELAITCATATDGSVGVLVTAGGEEAASYTDDESLGTFDQVTLFGEWKGEKIPPNDFNPAGGGLTFTFDNVVVVTQ